MLKGLHRVSIVALTTALAAGIGSQARGQTGQETPNPNQAEITRMQHQIELLQQQSALEKQRADLWSQRMQQLGLTNDATGTTDLKEKGGQFEGWLLSASAIGEAAGKIADDVGTGDALAATRPVMLLAGDEAFDLSLPRAMQHRMQAMEARAEGALAEAGCPAARRAGPEFGFLPSGALPLLGTLIGSLRTDTTITGYEGPTEPRLVISALAGQARGRNWIVPSSISGLDPDQPSELEGSWSRVTALRTRLGECRNGLRSRKPAPEARLTANLETIATEISTFETQNVMANPSPLLQAARLEKYAADPDVRLLRVYVGRAGGSLLVRRNLWTALGAPAVGISGGAAVEWRRINPFTGQLDGGGSLICVTELSNMRRIQAGESRAPRCVPQLDASAAARRR
jgi:hypothetical protein